MTRRLEVFVTSPWVPVEWVKAHGLRPRGVWRAESRPLAAVPEGVCAFAQQMADLAKPRPDAAVVFTTACDQLRRAADVVAEGGNTRHFLFNLPATWQSPAARRLYHAELARLGKFLERLGGQSPTDVQLATVLREFESRRTRLRELCQTGSARQTVEALAQFLDAETPPVCAPSVRSGGSAERRHLSESAPAALCQAAATGRVPLALVGGPLLASQWTMFDAIESTGGCIVLNASEPGERCLLPPLGGPAPCRPAPGLHPVTRRQGAGAPKVPDSNVRPELGGEASHEPHSSGRESAPSESGEEFEPTHVGCYDPEVQSADRPELSFTLLADHYFDHAVDVFHRPNSRLYTWLGPRLAERRVRGIVLWVHVACDLWRAEAASFRETFGLPVLTLDAHEVHAGGLRDTNRLAAFIESLQ